MVRYEFSLCIGQANTDSGITVKCHDDGISFLIKLMVCRQVSKWRTKEEAFAIPEGSKVILKISKPDNTKCLISGTVKAEGVLFKSRPEAFTVAGISEAEVSVYGPDGRRATTATFNIDVPEECVCNCEVESGPYIDIIGEQIKAAKEAEAGAKKAAEEAMMAQVNTPKIGDNGNWFVWDFEKGEYVDTGVAASGSGGGGRPADMESTNNRVTTIDETSDDEHYPTAKAVFDVVGNIEEALDGIIAIQESFIAQSPANVSEGVPE